MQSASFIKQAHVGISFPKSNDGRTEDSQDPLSSRRSFLYHLKSIWLFTFSDLKTIVGPKTLFGTMNALASPVYNIQIEALKPYAPLVAAFWVWINLLPFVIDNQRRTESILEDRSNKPWRPLPSGRMSQNEARTLMMTLYPTAFVVSLLVGGQRQSIALMILGYWYNSMGGSSGVLSKNFINGCGFLCFASGAMEVALGKALPLSTLLVSWFLIIWGVVFTTVQTQDLPDQAGDLLCNRKTIPLVLGDLNTRWITAIFMGVWSVVCPFYWKAPLGLYVLFASCGFLIGFRTLSMKQVEDDKRTFRLWNAWMAILYSIPLITHLSRRLPAGC